MNNALIQIIEHNGQRAVNARELHAFLEVGKDFSSWIKKQIERCDLVEYQDFEVFTRPLFMIIQWKTYEEVDQLLNMPFPWIWQNQHSGKI